MDFSVFQLLNFKLRQESMIKDTSLGSAKWFSELSICLATKILIKMALKQKCRQDRVRVPSAFRDEQKDYNFILSSLESTKLIRPREEVHTAPIKIYQNPEVTQDILCFSCYSSASFLMIVLLSVISKIQL